MMMTSADLDNDDDDDDDDGDGDVDHAMAGAPCYSKKSRLLNIG
jgi:hypothetical protein